MSVAHSVSLLCSLLPVLPAVQFIPNFARIGSWNVITWMTLEQLKLMYHNYSTTGSAF